MCVLRHVAGSTAWGGHHLIKRPWSWRWGVDGGWRIIGIDRVKIGCRVVEEGRFDALFAVRGHCHICVCWVVGEVDFLFFSVVAPV